MRRTYYVAVNRYRSSTDNGFVNTWSVYRCRSAQQQRHILHDGLPVSDTCHIDHDGRRSAMYSTLGVRRATPAERRQASREYQLHGESAVPMIG